MADQYFWGRTLLGEMFIIGEHFGKSTNYRERTFGRALIVRAVHTFFEGRALDATITRNWEYNMKSMAT